MTAPAPRRPASRAAHRLRDERGMTLIEVLVAGVVLVIGLLGLFDGLSTAQRGSTGAERWVVMTEAGEQALAAVEALPYANVADSATPTKTSWTNANDPTYYVSSCGASACYQWNPADNGSAEPLAVDPINGLVAPGPTTEVVPAPGTGTCTTSSTSGCRFTYVVYRFVTDVTDPACSQSGVTCASSTSYKRVTIAVRNVSGGPPLTPFYISTYVSNKVGGPANPLTQATTTCQDGTSTVACEH